MKRWIFHLGPDYFIYLVFILTLFVKVATAYGEKYSDEKARLMDEYMDADLQKVIG